MWTAGAVVQGLVLLALVSSAGTWWGWFDLTWWVVVVVVLLATAYAVVMPAWRYAVHRWEVTESAVYTQTGWWAIEQRIAPMSRIQTVDYEEHAIGRLFGLAAVTVTTASAAGALEINGLDKVRARELVGVLTERADAVPGDAT
jgi:membrane protein YdbS with pleckstrin-like domain